MTNQSGLIFFKILLYIMLMRNCLTVLLNIVFKKDLELLYGKDTTVEVNTAKYCTTNKTFLIDCTLKISDITLYEEVGLEGLKYLIDESWRYAGDKGVTKTLVINVDLVS